MEDGAEADGDRLIVGGGAKFLQQLAASVESAIRLFNGAMIAMGRTSA